MADTTEPAPTLKVSESLAVGLRILGRTLKLAPGLTLFALAWMSSAAAALIAFGLLAGWRDMRIFTQTDTHSS